MTLEEAFSELNSLTETKNNIKEAIDTQSICPKCGSRNVTFVNKIEEADPTGYFRDDVTGEEFRTEYFYNCNQCGCNYKDIIVEMHASEILQELDTDDFNPEHAYDYHVQVARDHIGYSVAAGDSNPKIADYFIFTNKQDLKDYAETDYEYNKYPPTEAQLQQTMQAIIAAHKFVLEDDNFWDNEIYSVYKIPRSNILVNKIADLRITCKNNANIK